MIDNEQLKKMLEGENEEDVKLGLLILSDQFESRAELVKFAEEITPKIDLDAYTKYHNFVLCKDDKGIGVYGMGTSENKYSIKIERL